jgi:uncharacterized protein YlxW (UPF0749 family)
MESQIIAWVLEQGGVVLGGGIVLYVFYQLVNKLSDKLENLEKKNEELNNKMIEIYASSVMEMTAAINNNTQVLSKVEGKLNADEHG